MDNNTQDTLPAIRNTFMLNAPIEKVWDVVSTSEGIASWFMPNNFKAEVGHQFEINAGPFGMSPCKVTTIDPPNKLSFEWGKDWMLTFELKDIDNKTEFTLTHSGWDANKVTEFGQSHEEVRKMMSGGWVGLEAKLVSLFA
ncbi:SRPBCC domain-containing protein [Paenibacillus psychroresistens]|uniref:SRPBCC domain-containing protein n=1 Tax=Paenibacillus psychroresistens TaxID=1778678 RepID=A0A6B8RQZ5_9BACL|nr:SRPBCC domain-containing protein [Paenibacillus psychroresistens]QGQ98132.1 SRPBCC domain-containing protein [Paenibacillus psychroresistens]